MTNKIKEKILKINISGRILLFFGTLLVISLSVGGYFFRKIYTNMMVGQVQEASLQTARSIKSNIVTVLKNVNNSSILILSNPDVQKLLKSSDGYKELELIGRVNNLISSMMASYPEIYSVYLIDKNGHRYYSDTSANNFMMFNDDYYSGAWFKARYLNGGSYYVKRGGELFKDIPDNEFVSNVRIINDIETQKPIGGLLINISISSLNKTYRGIAGKNGAKIYLFDEGMNLITSSSEATIGLMSFLNRRYRTNIDFSLDMDSNQIYTFSSIEPYGWSIVSVMPIVGGEHLDTLMLTALTIVLVMVLLVFIGSIITARMITKPVNILVDSMADMGQGDLKKVKFETTIKEFNSLRDGYNSMTDEIRSLIDRTVINEKLKRKAELNTLQAQIKPHFLYNTFDSISSLALMGKNDDVYKMVSSLGSFYRTTLSKGREVIPLSQELEALKSYINILELRYNNFKVDYRIECDLKSISVLKLILQPFIENSIYHGIKPKGEDGTIEIGAYKRDDYFVLKISDDGVGMDADTLQSLFNEPDSFGVRGTVNRISLFYGRDDLVKIDSSVGVGTFIEIRIPFKDVSSEI